MMFQLKSSVAQDLCSGFGLRQSTVIPPVIRWKPGVRRLPSLLPGFFIWRLQRATNIREGFDQGLAGGAFDVTERALDWQSYSQVDRPNGIKKAWLSMATFKIASDSSIADGRDSRVLKGFNNGTKYANLRITLQY